MCLEWSRCGLGNWNVSARQAALNRSTATDKHWNRKVVSQGSVVTSVERLPIWAKNSWALTLMFISLFVSLSAWLRENSWTDLHEIFREGVEWPQGDLIKFMVNLGIWVSGSKVNLLSPDIAIWFDCCLLAVLCCHLATGNVMKLLFVAFCYITTQRWGLLCFAPHHVLSVFSLWLLSLTLLVSIRNNNNRQWDISLQQHPFLQKTFRHYRQWLTEIAEKVAVVLLFLSSHLFNWFFILIVK